MAIRSIFVHVDDSPAGVRRVDVSTALARDMGAHLTGVFAIPPALPRMATSRSGIPAGTQPEAYEMERGIRRFQQGWLAAARDAEQRFRQTVNKLDVEAEWRTAAGTPGRVLADYAVYADLIVVGHQQGESSDSPSENVTDQLVMAAGCPLLVIPTQCHTRALGNRVFIAWNTDGQAHRALRASLPLLKRANKVEIITVGDKEAVGQAPPAMKALRKYLAHHAILADYCALPKNGQRIGDALISRASEFDADMIVMGAYHHSRIREVLLGGVTRHLFQNTTLPLLIAH